MPFEMRTVVTLVTIYPIIRQTQKLYFSDHTKKIIKQAFEVRNKCEQLLSPQAKCYQKIIPHLRIVDKWIKLLTQSAMSESRYIPLRKEQKVMFRCNHRIAEVIRLITSVQPNRNKIPEPVPTLIPFPNESLNHFKYEPMNLANQLLRLAIFHHNVLTTLQHVIKTGCLKEQPRFERDVEYLKSARQTAWTTENDFISCQIMVDSIALHVQHLYGPPWPQTTNPDTTFQWIMQQSDSEDLYS